MMRNIPTFKVVAATLALPGSELQNSVSWWLRDDLYEVIHGKVVAAVDVRWV